jgi:cystathionine gamma-lyase
MNKYTRLLHNNCNNSIIDPIYLGTINNVKNMDEYENIKNIYSRCGNSTRDLLEKNLAILEDANFSLTFSSGMAILSILIHLNIFKNGIIACKDLYSGTKIFFNDIYNYSIEYIDFNNYNDIQLNNLLCKHQNKILWIESPSNPLLEILDLNKISNVCKKYNIISIVDNTFLSPIFQNPLNLGFDIVTHSISKYINGMSDVIMGCIMTNNEEIYTNLLLLQKNIGSIPSPFDCYLVNRSLKTLYIRMKQHEQNALKVASLLEKNKYIKKVIYPGLDSYKTNIDLKKQMCGFGGIISFYLYTYININKFLNDLQIIYVTVSLGSAETLIQQPYNMTHYDLTKEERENLNITPHLIRLSIGLEDYNDIYNDINNSLNLNQVTEASL